MITIPLHCDHHFKKTTGVVRRKYALSFIFLPQGSVLMKVLHYQLSFLVIQFFPVKPINQGDPVLQRFVRNILRQNYRSNINSSCSCKKTFNRNEIVMERKWEWLRIEWQPVRWTQLLTLSARRMAYIPVTFIIVPKLFITPNTSSKSL